MKQIIIFLIILSLITPLFGCGNNKEIGGHVYTPYGLINENDKKNPDVEYRLIIGNIFWSIVFIETIIVPIYFFGFSLYEPVGLKAELPKGAVK